MRPPCLLLALACLAPLACKPEPEPQIVWPESVLHPKPYEAPEPRPAPPEPIDEAYMCHAFVVAELHFEPGGTVPIDRDAALAERREGMLAWQSLPEYERPSLFVPIGVPDVDGDLGLAHARAEAMYELALDACIDPSQLVRHARFWDHPAAAEPRADLHRAILLANSSISCLL